MLIHRIFLLSLLFLGFVLHVNSATSHKQKIDSFRTLLTSLKGQDKINVYLRLGNLYKQVEFDSTIVYYQSALSLAKGLKNKNLEARAYRYLGIAYKQKAIYDKALDHYHSSLTLYKEINDRKGEAKLIMNIGNVMKNKGSLHEAFRFYEISQKIFNEIDYMDGIADNLTNKGIVFKLQGDFSKALSFYFKAVDIRIKTGNKPDLTRAYNNIANIFSHIKEYEKALVYHKKSLGLRQSLKDDLMIAMSLINIAEVYQTIGNLDSAMICSKSSNSIYSRIGYAQGLFLSYRSLGGILYIKGQYDSALVYFNKAASLIKDEKDKIGNLIEQANSYRHLGNLQLAILKLDTCAQLGLNKYDLFTRMDYVQSKYELLKKRGDLSDAIELHQQIINIKDSILNSNSIQSVKKVELQYKFNKDLEIKEARDRLQNIIYIALIIFIFLIALFFLYLYREKSRTNKIVEEKSLQLERKNKDIIDSITYAKKIQDALFSSLVSAENVFNHSFILFNPKEQVSGDFYWIYKDEEGIIYFSVVDCTGHGVPGAFMSMIGISLLNQIVIENKVKEPDQILNDLRRRIIDKLNQKGMAGEAREGMDMSLCKLDPKQLKLTFAGAYNPLYIVRNKKLIELKADRQPIGFLTFDSPLFTKQVFYLEKNDMIYLFTDGYADQFGGPSNKKFKYKPFKRLLVNICEMETDQQKNSLITEFKRWMGNNEQVDDVCVMGIRV